jgi:translation initiation factor 4G
MFGEIADDQTYSDAVGLVFDKALSEPNFSRMYAELCVELNKFTPKWADVDEKKPPYYFRRNLLNKCQEEFEKQTKEIPLPEEPEERAIAKDKRKRRKLGNVKFIGELFKHKSVSEKIIIECFSGLFSDIARYKKEGDKEMLESTSELLCKLLATTGKLLESKAKAQLDVYINEIKKYSNDEAFSSRMRFFFQEMGALRAHDWKPRREENVPKTITQIHAEALAKEFEDEVQAMVMTKPPIRSSPQVTTKQVQAQPQGSLKITVVKPVKQTEKAPQKQAPQQSTLSLETLEQKLTDIVEEYLASLDAKNAVSSMMDVRSPIAFSKFVEIGILNVLDKREKDRESLSKLFTSLSQHGLLKPEHMLTGLSPVLELVDDLEIDIPGCSKFVGKFVGLAVASNILPASYVDGINKPDIKTTALQYVNVANQ